MAEMIDVAQNPQSPLLRVAELVGRHGQQHDDARVLKQLHLQEKPLGGGTPPHDHRHVALGRRFVRLAAARQPHVAHQPPPHLLHGLHNLVPGWTVEHSFIALRSPLGVCGEDRRLLGATASRGDDCRYVTGHLCSWKSRGRHERQYVELISTVSTYNKVCHRNDSNVFEEMHRLNVAIGGTYRVRN